MCIAQTNPNILLANQLKNKYKSNQTIKTKLKIIQVQVS